MLLRRVKLTRWSAGKLCIHTSILLGLLFILGCSGNSDNPDPPRAPAADFIASPTSGMFPVTVTFDASSTHAYNGTIESYQWDFGDGITASGRVVSHEYTEPGDYTVTLTAINHMGHVDTRVREEYIEVHRTLWRHDVDKPIYYSAPALGDDGTIYVSTGILIHTNVGRVHAINPDGSEKWVADLDENTPPPDGMVRAVNNGSSPAIGVDGTVFVIDHRNVVYAFDPETGERRWTNSDYESDYTWAIGQKTPAIANDGTLYFCSDLTLIALDPVNGEERWQYRGLRGANICANSAVVNAEGIIYITSNDWLYAFNPDGSLHWSEPFVMTLLPEKSTSSPAIGADGVIYFGTEMATAVFAGFVYAVNPDGTLKWRYEVPGERHVRASPAIGSDGTIYVTTKAYIDSELGAQPALCIAFDPDGSVLWTYEIPPTAEWIPADSYTSPAIGIDGAIYFAAETGHIYALNPDGTLRWRENFHNTINWSSPVILDDGTLYIGGNQGFNWGGRLVAVQTESFGLDPGPWPKFRGNFRNTGKAEP